MKKLVLAATLLALMATTADARRRHHHRFHMRDAPVMMLMPGAPEIRERGSRSRMESSAQLVPRDWQLQAPDVNWKGRRYIAPDGSAWLALYATAAANDAQARFRAVTFADGEEITHLRGDRDRLTVSGVKADRIFYRKVQLACDGTIWRHIALEYPANEKMQFDRFVERASRGFERIADDGCGENLFSPPPQPVNTPPAEQPAADGKPAQPN